MCVCTDENHRRRKKYWYKKRGQVCGINDNVVVGVKKLGRQLFRAGVLCQVFLTWVK